MGLHDEVTQALDFFRRHQVSPRAAHRWLEETLTGSSELELDDEVIVVSQEARTALVEQLRGLTMDGAL